MDRLGALLSVYVLEANGPADGYAAYAQADRLTQGNPRASASGREEQRKRLCELGEDRAEAVSRAGPPVSGFSLRWWFGTITVPGGKP